MIPKPSDLRLQLLARPSNQKIRLYLDTMFENIVDIQSLGSLQVGRILLKLSVCDDLVA